MNTQYQLSDVAKNYLSAYHCILDEMIKGMSMAPLTDSISGKFYRADDSTPHGSHRNVTQHPQIYDQYPPAEYRIKYHYISDGKH